MCIFVQIVTILTRKTNHAFKNIFHHEEGCVAFELSEYLHTEVYTYVFIEPL